MKDNNGIRCWYINNQPYYRTSGVTSLFKKQLDKDTTMKEARSALRTMGFPIIETTYRDKRGAIKPMLYYNVWLIKDWLANKGKAILDMILKIRNNDTTKLVSQITKKKSGTGNQANPTAVKPPKYDRYDRYGEYNDPEEEMDRLNKLYRKEAEETRERRRREEIIRKQKEMEDELRRERMNPEEDMEHVSKKLLKKGDVYYDDYDEDF